MKVSLASLGFLLLPSFTASAATVTYALHGFVTSYPTGFGTKPADYGRVIPITIKLNTSAPSIVSANTALYGNNFYGSNDPADPIVSIKVGDSIQSDGGYDTVQITYEPGQASIIIQRYVVQTGFCKFSFLSSTGRGVSSLKIPTNVFTLLFDTSTFSYAFEGAPGAFVAGDMTSIAVPPGNFPYSK